MSQRCAASAGVAALLLSSACGLLGGQTGSEETDEAGEAPCSRQTTPLAPSETSTLGFTPDELARTISGTRSAELVWSDAGNGIAFDRAHSTTTLSISVAPSGSARHVHLERRQQGGLEPACPADEMELDAVITLSSADGALNERFMAPLHATRSDSARLDVNLELAELGGDLRITPSAPRSIRSLRLNAVLGAGEFRGTLSGQVEETHGESASVSAFLFACWPASGGVCAQGEPIGL